MKIAVLGANGMLGTMVKDYLSEQKELEVVGFTRDDFDARTVTSQYLNTLLSPFDWVINCIGIIKPYIKDDPLEAIYVNSLFPHRLVLIENAKIIHITTDCVFSGRSNSRYKENTEHDPTDIYGMTKSLGEPKRDYFYNFRCSIIGPKKGNPSLFEWFMNQPKGANIKGFTNHFWNGITTLAYAKICYGLIKASFHPIIEQHIIPSEYVTKYGLLLLLAEAYQRSDISIQPVEAEHFCSRKLGTVYERWNQKLWDMAGYDYIPSIGELVFELKDWQKERNL